MPLTGDDIERLFSVGDTFPSITGRAVYRITEIDYEFVRIQPTAAKTPLRLNTRQLSVVFDHFNEINTAQYSDGVQDLLRAHHMRQTQTEPHLYALVREYRSRSADQQNLQALASEPLPEEVADTSPFLEGSVTQVTIKAYERNPEARAACIRHYGRSCYVCGFNFGAVYGATTDGFIHVHHLRFLSEIGEEYEVDPIVDLRPVCPNCHAVIRLGRQNRSIEDIRRLMAAARDAGRA